MAFLYDEKTESIEKRYHSGWLDRQKKLFDDEGWQKLLTDLGNSCTVYVGEIPFSITENQIFSLFSLCGHVEKIVMGVNQKTGQFEGFCFVIFDSHKSADLAFRTLNETSVFNRTLVVHVDVGFVEGRQYGRGSGGGQLSRENDPKQGRKGWKQKFGGKKGGKHKKRKTNKPPKASPADEAKSLDDEMDSYWNKKPKGKLEQKKSKEEAMKNLDLEMEDYWKTDQPKQSSSSTTTAAASSSSSSSSSSSKMDMSDSQLSKPFKKKKSRKKNRSYPTAFQIKTGAGKFTSKSQDKKYVLPEYAAAKKAEERKNEEVAAEISSLFDTMSSVAESQSSQQQQQQQTPQISQQPLIQQPRFQFQQPQIEQSQPQQQQPQLQQQLGGQFRLTPSPQVFLSPQQPPQPRQPQLQQPPQVFLSPQPQPQMHALQPPQHFQLPIEDEDVQMTD